jgi:hypothetical protein
MATMTPSELDAAEAALGVPLPAFYRQLLAEVGHGAHGRCELYHPAGIRDLYEPFFDNPADLFAPYFPIGCDNARQEVWVIDTNTGRVASIWHETVPEDWAEESWLDCAEWRSRYFNIL